jgi:CRP-like cAMP-binding protein
VAVFVLRGMLGRYQTLPSGERQFLSFHIAGDMPDIQSLFLAVMDHSLCTLDEALIALLPHDQLINLVLKYPGVGFAFWRITLVDAAIFRQAITNNSTRKPVMRIAHFFCEQYYRAREAGLVKAGACSLPLSQEKLGQTLGMSLVSANRTLQDLRRHGLLDFRAGTLQIAKWRELTRMAGFDPAYLHVAKESNISRITFGRRRR